MKKQNKLNKIVSGLIVIGFLTVGYSQALTSDELKTTEKTGAFGLRVGTNVLDNGNLNSKFGDVGIKNVKDRYGFIGGTCYEIHDNRIVTGGEGGFYGQKLSSTGEDLTVGGGYAFFDLGYAVVNREHLKVFPLIGAGFGGIDIEVNEIDQAGNFSDILGDSKTHSKISKGAFLLNVALGTDYWFNMKDNETGKGGWMLGIRAGYVFSPTNDDWKLVDEKIAGGPEMGLTGPYLHVIIGGAGISK